jgi:hypothetical protein
VFQLLQKAQVPQANYCTGDGQGEKQQGSFMCFKAPACTEQLPVHKAAPARFRGGIISSQRAAAMVCSIICILQVIPD